MAAGLIASPVAAQEEAGRADRLIESLTKCRTIADAAARLPCLDAAVAAILAARDRREVVVIDREGVRQAKRSLFGFSLPKIRLFGRDGDAAGSEPEVQEITSQIAAVGRADRTRYALRLADGTQWQTTETVRFPPQAGDPIKITAGILGSYRATIRNNGAGRVIRVR